MSLTSDLRKLQTLPGADRRLLLEAIGWLGAMRVAIRLLPFRRIVAWLKLGQGEGPAALDAPRMVQAARIGWAVRAASARVPWKSACFDQALAGMMMLKRLSIPGTIYLGVAKTPGESTEVAAHAWLRSGEIILTGATGRERFSIISSFTDLHQVVGH
jgi:hypothetical protein